MKLPLTPGLRLEQSAAVWPASASGLHRMFLRTADGEVLSVRKLAVRAGLDPSTIQRIKTGYWKPGLESGLRIAQALGRSPWWVLEYWKRARAAAAGRPKKLSPHKSKIMRGLRGRSRM